MVALDNECVSLFGENGGSDDSAVGANLVLTLLDCINTSPVYSNRIISCVRMERCYNWQFLVYRSCRDLSGVFVNSSK